jgi:hypothetical protein
MVDGQVPDYRWYDSGSDFFHKHSSFLHRDFVLRQPLVVADVPARANLIRRIVETLVKIHDTDTTRIHNALKPWLNECLPRWPDAHINESVREVVEQKRSRIAAEMDECDADEFESALGDEHTQNNRRLLGDFWRAGRTLLLGGPMKACKTQLMLRLSTGLAHGTEFLGIPCLPDGGKGCRVLVLSSESGRPRLEQWLQLMDPSGCDPDEVFYGLHGFDTDTPGVMLHCSDSRLALSEKLDKLPGFLRRHKIDVLFIDPLYLNLPDTINIASAPDVGRWLRSVTEACAAANCTLGVAAHSLKYKKPGRHMTLQDLSGAGVGEFARAWILVNRDRPFDPRRPGEDDLLVNIGSSDAGAMACAVKIRNGENSWECQVTSDSAGGSSEPDEGEGVEYQFSQPKRVKEKGSRAAADLLHSTLAAMPRKWIKVSRLRQQLKNDGKSGDTVNAGLYLLQKEGVIEARQFSPEPSADVRVRLSAP